MGDKWAQYEVSSAQPTDKWAQYESAPTSPTPPEKPGVFQRFREALGIPSLDQLTSFLTPSSDTATTINPREMVEKSIMREGSYLTNAKQGVKEGLAEAEQAAQNVAHGGPTAANAGKAAYGLTHAALQAIPFVGPTAETVGEDVHDENYRGAIGGAAGALTAAALPEIADKTGKLAGRVKSNIVVSPELKAAAAEVPDAATAAKAARTVKDINTGATQELQGKLHGEFDSAATQVGVDVSDAPSASVKAHRIGDKLQKDAQAMYQKADDVAKQVTGQPGRFQQFKEDIQGLREQIRGTYDPTIKANLEQQLGTAQTQYAQYQQALQAAGMDTSFVKQADKQWSIGTSYKEVGHKLATGEMLSGDLRPSSAPLNNAVKSISKEGAKRGHVLENAMGPDSAGRVTEAVDNAATRVNREAAETRQAKQTVKATTERAGAAQKQVESVRRNQRKLGYGVAGALLSGGAVKYGGALVGKRKED